MPSWQQLEALQQQQQVLQGFQHQALQQQRAQALKAATGFGGGLDTGGGGGAASSFTLALQQQLAQAAAAAAAGQYRTAGSCFEQISKIGAGQWC